MEEMTCPDPTALDRTGTPDADPALVEHLKTCPSCWLDWQIQHGLRHVMDPQLEVRTDLNERVIARIALRAARLEKTLRWRDLAICAALVTAATCVFVLAAVDSTTPVMSVSKVLYTIGAGIAAALYVRREDRNERASAVGAAGASLGSPA
ncbi:MAG: hypothetical protein OXE96_08585 [Gemmatimonadetes bacterium]|nr:hypothetical protein [Gemmatimonadota bacterium]